MQTECEVIFEPTLRLELDELFGVPFVSPHVALIQQKITRIGECRSDEEVLIELARRLNLEQGTESLSEIFQQQLSTIQFNYSELAGITLDDFKKKGFVSVPIHYRKFEEAGFMTGSGKVELASGYLESLGYDPLPYYEEPPESPVSVPELTREYPLILTTGGRLKYFFCSEFRQVPSLRRKHPDPLVELPPETAKAHGIIEGDWVWIETLRGEIQQKAKLTGSLDRRVINVQHDWWFPEDPAPEYGVWKSNANVLTSNEAPYDPAMGTYQLRALLCRIRRVDDEASIV